MVLNYAKKLDGNVIAICDFQSVVIHCSWKQEVMLIEPIRVILKPGEHMTDSGPGRRERRKRRYVAYCVSLPKCSEGLNMTPLHPDSVLQDKSKRERERKGERERMHGSDPPRPCQLFLTSLVAPCRLILPNYIPHWQKVGPWPPLQKSPGSKTHHRTVGAQGASIYCESRRGRG